MLPRPRSRIPTLLGATIVLVSLALAAPVAADHSVKITTTPPSDGGTYTMRVDIDKFSLVPVGQKNDQTRGEGHVHYLINGSPAPGDYATTADSFTFRDLKPDDVVGVELVHNDHSSYEPRVIETQTVGATNESPGPATLLLVGLSATAIGLIRYGHRRA